MCWKQSALFQAAARNLLADAAVQTVQQLRRMRHAQDCNMLKSRVMKAWWCLCCEVVDMRFRASAVQAMVLQRMVVRSFCQWSRDSARIKHTRALVQDFTAAACGRMVLMAYAKWSWKTEQAKEFARRVLFSRAKSRMFLAKTCFGALKSHMVFRQKMKSAASRVSAIMQRLNCVILHAAFAEWRKETQLAFLTAPRVMLQRWVACASVCSVSAASFCVLAAGEKLL
jgi:hypothetical protein